MHILYRPRSTVEGKRMAEDEMAGLLGIQKKEIQQLLKGQMAANKP
jgi:plasmid maintenance system antidote protein VapI